MFNNIQNRKQLYSRFHKIRFTVGCEVGVHNGENALTIFKQIPGVKLYLVEPYLDHSCSLAPWDKSRKHTISSHENAKKIAHERLMGYNCEWLEMFSEDAVKLVPDGSLDFVHVDAEHAYDFTMLDTILWTRKVRTGGVVSGHDYDKPEVKTAVENYVTIHGFEFNCTQETKSPSWFFVKE
jgi:hypothetical protein